MNKWIDCHAHLYPPNFTLNEISNTNSIVVTVPETLQETITVYNLSQEYNHIKPCAGLHPLVNNISVRIEDMLEMEQFINLHHNELIAIGECGLDYTRHVSMDQRQIQLLVFQKHIQMSKRYNLPLNVHSRDAGHYAITEMIESNANGLLHAFNGKLSYALKGASHGLYFSIPPIVIRDEKLQKLVKEIPIKYLVLETDSPALSPVKGQINTPDNILISAQEISRIKNISLDDVNQITRENSISLFGPKLIL